MRILVWYRQDLRLTDHAPLSAALAAALKSGGTVIALYCFDPRQFGLMAEGFPKTGAIRAQFLLESIADLRQQFRALGSDLLIRQGEPERVIADLVTTLEIDAVYYHQEVTPEETQVEAALKGQLSAAKPAVAIKRFWGHTLYRRDDLPFTLADLPELFTTFRKQVEKSAQIREPIPAPTALPALPTVDPGPLPTLADLGLTAVTPDARAVLTFVGGETTGQARMQDYIWTQDRLKIYKETRNGLLGADYSSKFSPWLAMGCLSPRMIAQQVAQYEDQRIANDSTYWMIFELLWRDYFRFICAKHGAQMFARSGLRGVPIPWKSDPVRFEQWKTGHTGFPLVDANMQELLLTGFMSNRGRQNVASFLTKNLGIDWRLGAAWFESALIDYDPCSNWGNWNYSAGVGNDARGFRFFNITKQAKDYDSQGVYVKHWLPELASVPAAKVHEPWKLTPEEQQQSLRLGVDYPNPIVDLFKSAAANEKVYNEALDRYSPK
jgi:deoxyribodipyrimidine photo-lyase